MRCESASGGGGSRHRVLDAVEHLDAETGLPAEAVLVVRRLDASVVGEPARLDGTDLRTVARNAWRAGRGSAPPDCAAVVFADPVQVLTGLATDVAAGRPLSWWWSALFDRRPRGREAALPPLRPTEAVTVAFSELAAALPAAAAANPSAIAAAAGRLDGATLASVLRGCAEAHAAPALAAVADRFRRSHADPRSDPSARPVGPASAGRATGPPGPPWAAWMPTAPTVAGTTAGTVRAAFVGSVAGLWRAPAVVRSAAYVDAVALLLDEPAPRSLPARRPAAPIDPPFGAGAGVDSSEFAIAAIVPGGGSAAPDLPPERHADGIDSGSGPDPDAEVGSSSPAPAVGGDEPVATRYGGAFYLLGLLAWLDLPAAADGEGEPGPTLTRWHVLALVLRAFGIDAGDPLFGVLVECAGASVAGVDHAAGEDDGRDWAYRLRPGVRASFGPPTAAWRWWAHDGHLVVTDPGVASGLIVADVPIATGDPAAVVAAEIAMAWPTDGSGGGSIGLALPIEGSGTASSRSPSERWAAALAGLVDALLARVGLDRTIIEVPATIEVGAMHVRVGLHLVDVDLGVRRAGLDRDPGWVPELGRIVQLVFG